MPGSMELECVGEGAFYCAMHFQGFTRFDEFQQSLGIAPTVGQSPAAKTR
jgi:hypothetical protein